MRRGGNKAHFVEMSERNGATGACCLEPPARHLAVARGTNRRTVEITTRESGISTLTYILYQVNKNMTSIEEDSHKQKSERIVFKACAIRLSAPVTFSVGRWNSSVNFGPRSTILASTASSILYYQLFQTYYTSRGEDCKL